MHEAARDVNLSAVTFQVVANGVTSFQQDQAVGPWFFVIVTARMLIPPKVRANHALDIYIAFHAGKVAKIAPKG